MFFWLSKILQYLISPLTWIVIIFILSFCLKSEKAKKGLRITVFVLLLIFTNPLLVNVCLDAWEQDRTPETELAECYDYGIVLTGMIFYDTENDKIEFGQSTDRILEAVRLYYAGRINKIFISGGSGLLLDQTHKESQLLKDYLVSINVPEEDIIIETESRNTHENAVEAAKILHPTDSSHTYLLITSASHFRRADKCFENEGFTFDSYPVDYCSRKFEANPETWLIPAPSAFSTWNMLLHEIAGYVMYDWSGYF
jgi:uncharacterized SAM-binding protein YcdF (DUF218 family)